MSKETVKVEFVRFRDDEGNPTCAVDFTESDGYCKFYRTTRFGTEETCVFADVGRRSLPLSRRMSRNQDDGSLIPCEKCILWNSDKD